MKELRVQIRKSLAHFALDVDLTLGPEVSIVFGSSGAGKTTLLDCIAGLGQPEEGFITLGERKLFDSSERLNVPVRRRRVAYLLQGLALFPHMTVAENAGYGLAHLPRHEREERVNRMLESFHVKHLAGRRPGQISGGERQRAALARALVTDPDCLLLDEPLSALDAPIKAQIIADLYAWNIEHRIPVLYVTHDRSEVFALGERVLMLDEGKITAQGTPHEVFNAPQTQAMAQLAGFENIFQARVAAVHSEMGTSTCVLHGSDLKLECPQSIAEMGAEIKIGIRAGDILVSTLLPEGLSARNRLPGRIAQLANGAEFVETTVICNSETGGEVKFLVHLTRAAVATLKLTENQPIWLVIKTYSCHLLRD